MTTLVKSHRPHTTAKQFTPTQPRSIPLFGAENPQQIHINWLDSGKPILKGLENQQVEVSLSHDDRFCLCVVGQGPQGCDILPVSHRSQADWILLLTSDRQSLFNQLLANGYDSVDIAGTRLWVAIEAFRKAFDARDISLRIDSQREDTVLFEGEFAGKKLYVMTFPVNLTKSFPRMVAVVVNKK